jgi:hypothetical protein
MKERLIVYKPFQPPNMVRQEVLIGGLQRRPNYKRYLLRKEVWSKVLNEWVQCIFQPPYVVQNRWEDNLRST